MRAHPEIVQFLLTTDLELGLAGQLAEALFRSNQFRESKIGKLHKNNIAEPEL